MPFGVAILGCGGYGLPIVWHIQHVLKKSAIYMDGGTQILFGIKGKRWMERPEMIALMNEHWVVPSADETPRHKESVEGGSYWG